MISMKLDNNFQSLFVNPHLIHARRSEIVENRQVQVDRYGRCDPIRYVDHNKLNTKLIILIRDTQQRDCAHEARHQ